MYCLLPVSYTHLDVYKRQDTRCLSKAVETYAKYCPVGSYCDNTTGEAVAIVKLAIVIRVVECRPLA